MTGHRSHINPAGQAAGTKSISPKSRSHRRPEPPSNKEHATKEEEGGETVEWTDEGFRGMLRSSGCKQVLGLGGMAMNARLLAFSDCMKVQGSTKATRGGVLP